MSRVLTALAAWVALGPAAVGADKAFRPIGLQPHANQKLTDDLGRGIKGNNVAAFPRGSRRSGASSSWPTTGSHNWAARC